MAEGKPAESRRREIADAALRVSAEQGPGRFTALAIAREIGVTDAALCEVRDAISSPVGR